jgi:hypothetical protein
MPLCKGHSSACVTTRIFWEFWELHSLQWHPNCAACAGTNVTGKHNACPHCRHWQLQVSGAIWVDRANTLPLEGVVFSKWSAAVLSNIAQHGTCFADNATSRRCMRVNCAFVQKWLEILQDRGCCKNQENVYGGRQIQPSGLLWPKNGSNVRHLHVLGYMQVQYTMAPLSVMYSKCDSRIHSGTNTDIKARRTTWIQGLYNVQNA